MTKKALHKIATDWEFVPYTLEDNRESAENKWRSDNNCCKKIDTITGNYSGKYQPIAIIGKESMRVGKSIDVDFDAARGMLGPIDLRHQIIKSVQNEVEKTLLNYTEKLRDHGINASYQDFDRSY